MTPDGFTDRQWWWIRVTHPKTRRFFLHYPPPGPAGHQDLKVYCRGGIDWARLVWKVCHECRRGVISKISLTPDVQRQGLGSLLINRALLDGPHYHWTTSPQSPEGAAFFKEMGRRTGAAFTSGAKTCEHIKRVRPGRAKPALDRRLQRTAPKVASWP